jgi:hypothetical protein
MSLRQYLNYMDKNDGKRPPKKKDPKKKDTVRRTGSSKPMSQRKFAGGGMASKMSAKGGARGGKKMMPGGMKNGGSASKFPDLTGDGRVTQADILKGRGVTKKRNGGMMQKKGFANGGAAMKKKGYSKGGAVSRKPRGVGAAKRGYGKAMR